MRIDSHLHFWKYNPKDYSWIDDSLNVLKKDFLPEDLEPVFLREMDGCVAVEARHSEAETEYLLKLADEFDVIKAVVGWVDIKSKDVDRRLEKFGRNSAFKGVRHTVYDQAGEFMLEPEFQNGIARLQDHHLTYDILVFDYQLSGAIELVKKFPRQAFVLDHLGRPEISKNVPVDWVKNINELASFENVYCKISEITAGAGSSSRTIAAYKSILKCVLNAFGEDRLMFGSNWPVCLATTSYAETLELIEKHLPVSSSGIHKITGENAASFYDIKS